MPTSGDEQRRTARYLDEVGAARMLTGADATPDRLRYELLELLKNPGERSTMADRAREHGRPDAASRVAQEIIGAIGKRAVPRS